MRFAASLTALGLMAALSSPAAAQTQGPCFYAAPNFQGQPMCIAPAQRVPNLGPMNDRVMSVQIPRGIRVTVCEHANFQGACLPLEQSVPNFAAIGGADKISSVASEPAGPGGPRAGAQQPPPPQGPPPGPPRGQQFGGQQPPGPPPGPQRGQQFGAQQPGPQYGGPPPRGPDMGGGDMRRQMSELRELCEDGDTRACVRLGIIIGENRERRAQWRRESPEFFWWER